MQTFLSSFPRTMSWLLLGLALVSIALFGVEARCFRQGRRSAFMGLGAMLAVLAASTASFLALAVRSSSGHQGPPLSSWLLPLVSSILLVAIYRLSFPLSAARRVHHTTLLVCRCLGAALSAGG